MNTKKPTLPAKGPRPVILPTLIRSRADRAANAWLEGYNPLRGLTLRRAQMIFDAARRGNDVRLQWIYENIEQSDPTLMICAERRASALVDLDWTIRPKASGRTRGFDEALAREQCALLEHAYGDAEEVNLFPALEHLSKAFFRGHAHIRPLWSADGLTLRGFDLLNGWNLCRDTVTDRWHWNPSASETLDFASLSPVPPGELVTLVRPRHIDYPAMAIYLRSGLGEREWGRFLERYGIPPVIITMPDTIDPSQVDAFCARAVDLNNGASGALPAGSTVTYAQEARGVNPFKEFLEHQQQLVVLMATGGMLTSLTGATGIGQGASDAHEETWRTIVRRDAALIATALNRTVTDALLDRAFPGRPHLAQFDFETDPSPTPAEIFDLAAKAAQAGYQIAKEELEERTGYRLEVRPQGPGLPAIPWNRAPLALNRQAPQSPLADLAKALQADLTPAADAVQALLKDPSPQAAQALIARLPQLLPDDPEMAAILEEELAAAFGDEVSRSPEASKPRGVETANSREVEASATPAITQEAAQALFDELMAKGTVVNKEGECHAKDPANCPYHGTGRFAGKDGKPAEGKAKPAPKELPPRPNAKASAADYRKANLTRGEAALGNILADHADVPAAMVSRKLGPIDFVWGREGNPGRDYEGGYGFSHIIAKHGEEAARRVPAILAYGKYFHDEQRAGDYLIVHQNEVVSLKRNSGNFFVVTSYEANKKATAYLRRGGQIENKAKDGDATL